MIGARAPGAVDLYAVQEAVAGHIARKPVEGEVAVQIGREMQAAVAGEVGKLIVDRADGLLERQYAIIVLLKLLLVYVRRLQVQPGKDCREEGLRLPRVVRDLVVTDRGAGNCDPARIIGK